MVLALAFAIAIAVVVALPWVAAFRFVGAAVTFVVAFVFALILVYFGTPSIAGFLWGGVGVITACFLFIAGFFSLIGEADKQRYIPFAVGVSIAVIYMLMLLGNSSMFRAQEYAALVPHIEQREWSADFQLKDPRHFRVSSRENATFLAGRAIGQATTLNASGQPNAIGS